MSRHIGTSAVAALALLIITGCSDDDGKKAEAASAAAAQPVGGKSDSNARAEIQSMLKAYNAALNGGLTADVMPLYEPDGVFMAPYSQSSVGALAIRKAYDVVFHELKFTVKFDVAELVVTAPDWAFVRTNSAGTTAHASTGKTTAEANQELFILHKSSGGKWRIARYSFSPTSPPAGG